MSTTASGFFGSGVVPKMVLLAGTDTWTVPDAFYGAHLLLTMIGGGGSGRSAAATDGMLGGAGGDCIQRVWYPVASGTGYTTGAGGASVASGDGNDGGTTTFGALSVSGGSGGDNTMTALIGTPGFIRDGTNGNTHAKNPGGPWGGDGGICHETNGLFGGGGGLVLFTLLHRTNSVDGQGYGAGGGGVTSGSSNAGKAGVIMLEWWEYA